MEGFCGARDGEWTKRDGMSVECREWRDRCGFNVSFPVVTKPTCKNFDDKIIIIIIIIIIIMKKNQSFFLCMQKYIYIF